MPGVLQSNPPIARLVGAIDLLRHRARLRHGFYGPFNGQRERIAIIEALCSSAGFGCAIETGTYRGTTTRFLAERFPQVLSIEINPRFATFSRLRLRKRTNVTIVEGDSTAELQAALRREDIAPPVFAYLDAHWGSQPLGKELGIFEESGLDYIAAIDDFEVPGDDGYGFDRARGLVIGPRLVFDSIERPSRLWVPSASGDRETGSQRGTGFVASASMETLLERLEKAGMLRPVARHQC